MGVFLSRCFQGSQAKLVRGFGNEVMLGVSLNIQETIGNKARGYHTSWLSWLQSDFINFKANNMEIGGCYLNLFWCLLSSQSDLLVAEL